jgi:hypothetical protein
MKFAEAFNRLGYRLEVPRLDWSAQNDDGVCLSLWRSEINWKDLSFDTRVDAGPPATWNAAGNNKRMRHLSTALAKFDGWVDVVVVDGVPGEGVNNATPWNPEDRQGRRWRVSNFDDLTGHFAARAVSPGPEQ